MSFIFVLLLLSTHQQRTAFVVSRVDFLFVYLCWFMKQFYISPDDPFNVSVLHWAAWAVRSRLPHHLRLRCNIFPVAPFESSLCTAVVSPHPRAQCAGFQNWRHSVTRNSKFCCIQLRKFQTNDFVQCKWKLLDVSCECSVERYL